MKLLWLCNLAPGKVKEKISREQVSGGLWVDHVLSGLRQQKDLEIRILCPGKTTAGQLDAHCTYALFPTGKPQDYRPELEICFAKELQNFSPDVIHIWGTEYAHTLAMVNAAEKAGLLDRTVISIQGLCSVYAGHYSEGLPYEIQKAFTFRDAVRVDNIQQQQAKFILRGKNEVEALKKAHHVIGRTDWDRACAWKINPGLTYHFCNETLREPFYEGRWRYESCQKHRVFASSCTYPVKGFHYLLEAFADVVKEYPDATLAVPGDNFLTADRLRRTSYQKYMADQAKEYGLADKLEFLGSLSAEAMKAEFLKANAFALPSTIENSPNSLGEAMLLGVPSVSADVGGVQNLLHHRTEGYVYQSTAPYMLSFYLKEIFRQGVQAEAMGAAAQAHAAKTHDPEKNLKDLLAIYRELAR